MELADGIDHHHWINPGTREHVRLMLPVELVGAAPGCATPVSRSAITVVRSESIWV